jgi:hypothetical protein
MEILEMTRLKLLMITLLVAVAASGIMSASASATMPAVTTASGALITNHLEILALKSGNAVLKSKLAGVNLEIVCEHEHVTGWILNTGDHALGFSLAHFLKCTMPKPAAGNCTIQNELIHVEAHFLLLLGGGTGFKEELHTEKNPYFTLLVVQNCSNAALNGTFEVNGFAVAEANNTTLELEFSETSGSALKFGGNAATYIDKIKPEMLGGGGFMIENGS